MVSVLKLLLLHMFWTFIVMFAMFLLTWGFNYQRTPIIDTLGLENRPARSDELQVMALDIVNGINGNYPKAREGQDLNSITQLPYSHETLNQRVENAFRRVQFLKEMSAGGLGIAKPLYFSHLASLLGFSGVYLPYTAEATFNHEVPAIELPFTIANQKAHQLGYAREDEANFIAYVVCTNAEDAFIRYSGYLHGVTVLGYIERGAVGRYREKLDAGPTADLEDSGRFWENTRSSSLHGLAMWGLNIFLRLNGVRRGVSSYDEDIPLIVGYYLKYPGGRMSTDGQSPDSPQDSPPENPQ
jgi:hypothetical protein